MKYKRSHFIGGGICFLLLAVALFSGETPVCRYVALFLFLLSLASFAVAIFGKAWRKPRGAKPAAPPSAPAPVGRHEEPPMILEIDDSEYALRQEEPCGAKPAAPPSAPAPVGRHEEPPWFLEIDDSEYALRQEEPYYCEPDGTRNETGCEWLCLDEDASLAAETDRLIRLRDEVRRAKKENKIRAQYACGERIGVLNVSRTFMIRIPSAAPLDALGAEKEAFLQGLRAQNIHVILNQEGRMIDLSTNERLTFTYESWAGSADDAATYGAVGLVRTPLDE